ncbi:hypothetical protein R1sor_012677 [Riccia sorocarpa]|uniref:Myb/SANT-like domain-containing protein n=1 Tax=Riccia sorocarpa TaxID=122646 RepID=A0ABD3I548_9MARC
MDRDGHGYEDGRGPVLMQCPCSSATSSSSSISEMRPRAMARSQKSAVRHRMTKHDFELMISYLEVPDNFNGITGGGRKTKVGGKNFTKTTAFGHMAVSLCAQGFPTCNGSLMGKKYNRYLEMYKKARTFYLGTGAGLTDADVAARLTLEEKMNRQCHFFMGMHALYGNHANIDPPAVGDAGLPDDSMFGGAPFCPDSQPVHTPFADAEIHELSGDEEEADDREEDPMDFLGDAERDAFENGTAVNPEVDDIEATAADNHRGGPGSDNQTAQSALDVDDEPLEVQAGNALQGSGQSAFGRQAREAKQLARIAETIEAERRARADHRSILMAELVKGVAVSICRSLFMRVAAIFLFIVPSGGRDAGFSLCQTAISPADFRPHPSYQTARPNPSTLTNIPSRGHINLAYICCMLTHKNDVVEFFSSMALLSGGNADRIWKDDEVVVLIHAVRDVWTAQMQDPTTLRIWDLIVSRLADAGIQCSSLQAKFKWDSVFSDQMAIAAKTGAEVFYSMSVEERTQSGLPAKYLKLWFNDISSFIRWKPIIWQTAPRPVL